METSHPLNFTKYCKRWKNITSLRLILETRSWPRPRQNRSRKNSEKNYLNEEEKKKICYEKLQTLQVSKVSVLFKI